MTKSVFLVCFKKESDSLTEIDSAYFSLSAAMKRKKSIKKVFSVWVDCAALGAY